MTRNDKMITAVLGTAAALSGLSEGYMCAVLFYILTVCAAFDMRERTVPDRFPAAGSLAWLLFAIAGDHSRTHLLQTLSHVMLNVAGALIIAAAVLILTLLYEKLRHRKAIGGGDIKLFFMIGLFIGAGKTLYVMLLACALAAIFALTGKKCEVFPWAPAIALAAVTVTVIR